MKPFYGLCYSIDAIAEGARLQATGSMFDTALGNGSSLIVDTANLSDLFQAADLAYESLPQDQIARLLKDSHMPIDTDMFCRMMGFQTALFNSGAMGVSDDAGMKRHALYKGGDVALSSVMAAQCMQCTEAAAVAHVYLKERGVDNSFFSGAVYWRDRSDGDFFEFAEAHCFNFIPSGDRVFLFDPANPFPNQNGKFIPRLYDIPAATFAAFEARGAKEASLLSLEEMRTGVKTLYGINAPDSCWLPRHIVNAPIGTAATPAPAQTI